MREWSEIVHDVQTNWLVYASMPFLAGLIGYVTKLVAIKMMFRPHRYRGLKPFGWQGIIPRRAPEMVEVLCQTLTGRLVSSGDIVSRVDGKELARKIERPLRKEVARIVPIVADEYQPALWHVLPGPAKDLVVQRAQDAAVDLVPKLVKALRKNIDDVFDLQEMVTAEFLADPDILESMFLDVGKREFRFIRRSGLVFGFAIGILQAAIWAATHQPLVMPVFGLFIGWFTDWAALRLIFSPKEPTRYLGVITWQGLFLKHRIPVSQEYGRLIGTRVLTADRIVASMFHGPSQQKMVDLFAPIIQRTLRDELVDVEAHVRRALGRLAPPELDRLGLGVGELSVGSVLGVLGGAVTRPVREAAGVGLDVAQVGGMADTAASELVAVLPVVLHDSFGYLDGRLQIEALMSEKMAEMTPEQFEGVLRPAFQADERTLIMVGAVLGFLVGELQVLLVEHLTHA
ncbi:DUF445 domain-containing protein [Nocardioides kongjuensis]|uniref:Uncharacterized membrane protein YheB (UPF0754 family) n=1 Tax=Nocardioides kongjuensis TaxID=349522 RepID=A0A852RK80_9ACTN|nr:DUF445 family protein [Nocardioides kongjuensis]NYD31485.1 uncharacterized membrane protein YheB (UPF0754 family) [Nocardioides kongjuensis]